MSDKQIGTWEVTSDKLYQQLLTNADNGDYIMATVSLYDQIQQQVSPEKIEQHLLAAGFKQNKVTIRYRCPITRRLVFFQRISKPV